MRILCTNKNKSDDITVMQLYHIMSEDKLHYYVINDEGTIQPYDKKRFNLIGAMAKIKDDIDIVLPNGCLFRLNIGVQYPIVGHYIMSNGLELIPMYVIQVLENTCPIAVEKDIINILEV